MLLLTRKVGEQIYIYPKEGTENMTVAEFFAGGQIAVTVSQIRGTQVKLGVDAPDSLTIVRNELES